MNCLGIIFIFVCFIQCSSSLHSDSEFARNSVGNPCLHEEGKQIIYDHHEGKIPVSESEVAFEEVTYTGAVLEYRPYDKWTDEGQGYEVVRKNAEAFVVFATQAKSQGADIFVTPEYGIQSLDMYYNDTAKFLTYTQFVPNPVDLITPCDLPSGEFDNVAAVQLLSCGAVDNGIYLVNDLAELSVCSSDVAFRSPFPLEIVDDCPEVGYFVYNTQVVFDRKGTVVARYRKQNLYLESSFTSGPADDSTAVFITDFNVAFTLEICFDIVYEHPAYTNVRQLGIRDVAMSTAWVDELPFDVADGIQNGWSRGLEANLLVAGHHIPEYNMLGSGIFKGYSGDLPNYVYDRNSGDVLLVSTVRTIPASSLPINGISASKPRTPSETSDLVIKNLNKNNSQNSNYANNLNNESMSPFLHTDLSNYTRVTLIQSKPGQAFEASACDADNFCCHLKYQYSGNLTYMLVVNSGQNILGDDHYVEGLQICGVVWCITDNYETCAIVELGDTREDVSFGPFSLSSATFSADVVYPIGLHRNLSLIDNSELLFSKEQSQYSIFSKTVLDNPLTLALYGRWFGNDILRYKSSMYSIFI